MMNYQDSLAWIHSKLKFGIKPGLKRMDWMLEQLGNPQKQVKAVHIVGTNGKGSTVANLQHIFTSSGYKVGTFTSPYIVDFRERISVDGTMISEDALIDLVSRVYEVVEKLPEATGLEPATEFEVITTMMFLYFAEVEPVDIVFIEAGLGGSQDSTNVFQPLLVICPSIGLDHQNILGDTYAQIAAEKVGVVKGEAPFIFATDRDDVRQVFLEKCNLVGSSAYELGRDFELTSGRYSESNGLKLDNVRPGLPGQHQISNAALCIKASFLLSHDYPNITPTNILSGLSQTLWIGRTELMRENLMIDGAHNNESIQALVALLKKDYAHKKLHFLFSAIDTKPVSGMLNQLATLGDVTVTTFDYLNAVVLENYPPAFDRAANFQSWLERVKDSTTDDFFIVTGSLYFISQVRDFLVAS